MSASASIADGGAPDVLVPLDVDPTPPPAGSRLQAFGGATMGTNWSVRCMLAPAASHEAAGRLRAALQAELDLVVAQMSHWEPDSLLARYNRAPAGSWHDLPSPFFDVIDYALQVHVASGGAYDPAAGGLVDLWGFGPAGRYDQPGFYAPQPAAIEAALATAARARPVLDRAARRVLQPGGAVLDLSAVAKGHAVDRLALCLEAAGARHYLAEIGGELRGAGVKLDGAPWWVEVEAVPDAAGDAAPIVALHGLSIATSGDYRRFHPGFDAGTGSAGRSSHTLDPRTGRPIANGVASCTVLAPTCMAADALSTALTVLGPDAGLAFAEARDLPARFLLRDGGGGPLRERVSSAWQALRQ